MKLIDLKSLLYLPNGFRMPKPGIPTGISEFDFDYGGLQPGISVLLARTGTAATSLLLAISLKAVRTTSVVWIGRHKDTEVRLQATCALFDVERHKVEYGIFPSWRLEGYYRCLGRWMTHPFTICQAGNGFDLKQMLEEVECGLLVLDLPLMEIERIVPWLDALKEMALAKGMTVLVRVEDPIPIPFSKSLWPSDELQVSDCADTPTGPASVKSLFDQSNLKMVLYQLLTDDNRVAQPESFWLSLAYQGRYFMKSMELDPSTGGWQDRVGNLLPDAGGISWDAADDTPDR